MVIVYLAEIAGDEYEPTTIVGVFSTHEIATAAIERWRAREKNHYWEYTNVTEWELDKEYNGA